MKTLTIEQFQEKFDEYLDKIESGESFLIKSEYGEALILPYAIYKTEIDDLVRIHVEHEGGS
jgi:hypothetical protein